MAKQARKVASDETPEVLSISVPRLLAAEVARNWQAVVRGGYGQTTDHGLEHEVLAAAGGSQLVRKVGEIVRNANPAEVAKLTGLILALAE